MSRLSIHFEKSNEDVYGKKGESSLSELTIWNALRSQGLSEAGTAGLMGNMYCESLLKSNNVEDRCPMSDDAYTAGVDSGTYPESTFVYDSYGYGLVQHTYYSRKQGLINYAKSKGVSIADEAMQCEFIVKELKSEYSSLYQYLCTTSDVYTAASRVCCEYERPAVNNISPRATKAQEYFNKYKGTSANGQQVNESNDTAVFTAVQSPSANEQSTKSCDITVRVLRKGDKGRDVFMLQCGLNDAGYTCGVADGDFGTMTEYAVNRLKAAYGLSQDGICDEDVWQILFQ